MVQIKITDLIEFNSFDNSYTSKINIELPDDYAKNDLVYIFTNVSIPTETTNKLDLLVDGDFCDIIYYILYNIKFTKNGENKYFSTFEYGEIVSQDENITLFKNFTIYFNKLSS
jgi:hypothetical protein